MSEYELKELGKFKLGELIILDEKVCKITDMKKSKPGKHGEAKCRLEGQNIFTATKQSMVSPVKKKMKKPILPALACTLVSMDADKQVCSIIDMESYAMVDNVGYDSKKHHLDPNKKQAISYIQWGEDKKITNVKNE